MLELVVPNHEEELRRFGEIGTTGFVIGFGLRYGNPDYFENRYPKAWTDIYEAKRYFYGDPVAAWTMSQTGVRRWSEMKLLKADLRGIMNHAKKFGLNYGATAVAKAGTKLCFVSLARPDRELSDNELSYIHDRIQLWAKLFSNVKVTLTDEELQTLSLLADGYLQEDAADFLNISRSTFKNRQRNAQQKLGAKTSNQAIARAVRQNLI